MLPFTDSISGRWLAGLRASRVARLSLAVVLGLWSLAALAPLLTNSSPWIHDDGQSLRFPLIEYLQRSDYLWLGGFVVFWCSVWRWRAAGRHDPRRCAARRRRVLVVAGLLALVGGVAVQGLEQRTLTLELFTWERLRLEGAGESEFVLWAPVRWSPEVLDEGFDLDQELDALGAAPPSREHPFGTDRAGGDLFARVVHGARRSLVIGSCAAVLALLIGVGLGALAGFLGGWADLLLSRVLEVFQCFPDLFLLLVVLAYLPADPWVLIALLGLLGWTGVARLTRAEMLRLRDLGFVDAARGLGCGAPRILFVHLLPHAAGPVLVAGTFGAAGAMLAEASLSYLGLGGQESSWGRLLQASRHDFERAPWILLFPGSLLVLAIASYHFLGEGLRDALDPRRSTLPRRRGKAGSSGLPARTSGSAALRAVDPSALLQARGLRVHLPRPDGADFLAVDGVDLCLHPGESVGLVGQSGSGKTVLSLALTRLLDEGAGQHAEGEVLFQGRDLLQASPREMAEVRGRGIGMVFQDASSSLDPVRRVGRQLSESLVGSRIGPGASEEVDRRLEAAGLQDLGRVRRAFPHQLSGGMQQRVALALATARDPALLIADEPTTALDVRVQARVLQQIEQRVQQTGSALLWISHDLAVVARMCRRVVVLMAGRVVEEATVEQLRQGPRHPYTRRLLDALPERRRDLASQPETRFEGAADWSQGCAWRGRCESQSERCGEVPSLRPDDAGGAVRCHHPDDRGGSS